MRRTSKALLQTKPHPAEHARTTLLEPHPTTSRPAPTSTCPPPRPLLLALAPEQPGHEKQDWPEMADEEIAHSRKEI